eukprot:7848077-Lingulodinium_polyedra.AAC.1
MSLALHSRNADVPNPTVTTCRPRTCPVPPQATGCFSGIVPNGRPHASVAVWWTLALTHPLTY